MGFFVLGRYAKPFKNSLSVTNRSWFISGTGKNPAKRPTVNKKFKSGKVGYIYLPEQFSEVESPWHLDYDE